MNKYIHTSEQKDAHARAHSHTPTHTHALTKTRTHARTTTHTHTHTHARTHAPTHARTLPRTHPPINRNLLFLSCKKRITLGQGVSISFVFLYKRRWQFSKMDFFHFLFCLVVRGYDYFKRGVILLVFPVKSRRDYGSLVGNRVCCFCCLAKNR